MSSCYQSTVRGQEDDEMMLASVGTLLVVTIIPYKQRFRESYEHSLASLLFTRTDFRWQQG